MTTPSHPQPSLTGLFSRRAGLTLLAALGLTASSQGEIPTTRAKRKRRPCGRPTIRCGKRCVFSGSDPLHCGSCKNQCATTEICQSGICV
jgi:hypothetical protein